MIEKLQREACLEPAPEMDRQVIANQPRQRVECLQPAVADRQEQQQRMIPARHHAVDERSGQERHGRGERLHENRHRDESGDHASMLEHVPQQDRGAPRSRVAGGERRGRLEDDGDARERAAKRRQRHAPVARRRIDDVDRVAAEALKDDEVPELPMQDRSGRQRRQLLDLQADAAAAKAIRRPRLDEGAGAGAASSEPEHSTELVERDPPTVIRQHHREGGRAAVGGRHLPHQRDAAAVRASHGRINPFSGGTRLPRTSSEDSRIATKASRATSRPSDTHDAVRSQGG